jgi:hypothetical protein
MCFGKICMNHSTVSPVHTRLKILSPTGDVISVDENGIAIEWRSASMVAAVTISATNS